MNQKKEQKTVADRANAVGVKKDQTNDTHAGFALGKENFILMAIGFAIIVIGYLLMIGGGSDDPKVFNADELFSFRRITLAPIVILFGFAFEVWAIMKRPKE